jgi:hypothetical protein
MYNMEITLRVEILILIFIVLFILFTHLFCGCTHQTPLEAMTNGAKIIEKLTRKSTGVVPDGPTMAAIKASTEGFTGANTNNGESSLFNLNYDKPIDTNRWFTPNLEYKPGQPVNKGVQNILNRKSQPVPLPEGELLMFANTPFKPECCPTTFSTSTGCACMTGKQYNYLINRGGNNVPYSEY